MNSQRAAWEELDKLLARLEADPNWRMPLEQAQRFHLLYERTASDLARFATFSAEPETRRYLEGLVARAYGEIHETRERRRRIYPFQWFFQTLPQTFRRHIRLFYLSAAITLLGCAFGGLALLIDPDSRHATMAFGHDEITPEQRVHREESGADTHMTRHKSQFSASLMTNNTRVSILTMALGITWGVGTGILLFYNGVILGAVSMDYICAGQTKFLLGWLLPHGVVEIPAILIAGQAGLLLGLALIGWGRRAPLAMRLRTVSRDLITLIFGVGVLLVWAGFIEAFLSQYHEPVIPYELKIVFGLLELMLLTLFLSRSGADRSSRPREDSNGASRSPAPQTS